MANFGFVLNPSSFRSMWFDGLGNSLSRFAPPSLPLPYQQVVAPFTMSPSSELVVTSSIAILLYYSRVDLASSEIEAGEHHLPTHYFKEKIFSTGKKSFTITLSPILSVTVAPPPPR